MLATKKIRFFRKHYGSTPLDLANIWFDLTVTDIIGAALNEDEHNMKGFRAFMIANHFLWAYDKNAKSLSNLFRVNEKYAQGEYLWNWVGKIAAMKAKKIKWPDRITDIYGVSTDGVDFKCWEPKDPDFPIDMDMKSQKVNKAGWKYLVALLVHEPKVVYISGPHKGKENDMTLFCQELLEKIRTLPAVMASGDLAFRTSQAAERGLTSWPNSMDPENLRLYKSRIRCRQETFFGQLKKFCILANTFEHTKQQHKMAFEAVVVIVQYQMDNGSPIYMV
jgi:hypothetical protein